jgi:hypothetical protein
LAVLSLGTTVALLRPHVEGKTLRAVRQEEREVAAWKAIGGWFRDHAAKESTIAVVVAGAIPTISGLRAIDLLGLNDAVIARTPIRNPGSGQAGHERSNPGYVLTRAPEYIVIGEYALHPTIDVRRPELAFYYPAERDLAASPEFARRYALRAAATEGGYFHYFARRDSSAR